MLLVTAAASTLAVAGIAAGASLLGAIVGAFAGGLSDHMVHKRHQQAVARAGGRLLRADLAACARTLRSLEQDGKWYRYHVLPTEAWDKYRNELAVHLSTSSWTVVVEGVINLRTWSAGMTKLGEPPVEGLKLNDVALRAAASLREQARLAYNALGELAGGGPVSLQEFGHVAPEQEALSGSQLVSG